MKKVFSMKQKAYFFISEGLSVIRDCLKPENIRLIFK